MPPSNSPETRLAVLETHHEADKEWRARTDRTLDKIADALLKMSTIEMQNIAQSKQLNELTVDVKSSFDALDARIKPIEDKLPGLELTSQGSMSVFKTVAAAVLSAIVAAGAVMLKGS